MTCARRLAPLALLVVLPLAACEREADADPDAAPVDSRSLVERVGDGVAAARSAGASARERGSRALASAEEARALTRERLDAVRDDPETEAVLKRAAWKGVTGEQVDAAVLLLSLVPVEDRATGEVVLLGDLARSRVEGMAVDDAYAPEAVAFVLLLDPRFFREQRVLRTGPGEWVSPAEAGADTAEFLVGSSDDLAAALAALVRGDGPACRAALQPLGVGLHERQQRFLSAPTRALWADCRERLDDEDYAGFREAAGRYGQALQGELTGAE